MSDLDNKSGRSRLEDEVLEILSRTDRKPPVTARARSWGRTLRARIVEWQSQIRFLDTAWGWFGLALVLIIVGSLVTGDSGLARQIFQFAGLAAVVIGVIRLFRPSVGSRRKTWRGREVNMRKPGIELGDKWDDWRKRR